LQRSRVGEHDPERGTGFRKDHAQMSRRIERELDDDFTAYKVLNAICADV
jgi:hypothetical protein